MRIRWGSRLRTVESLKDQIAIEKFGQRIVDNRGQFPILVIDDKAFRPIENLRRHNYNITHHTDAVSIDSVKRFPIVLCDLIGVGVSLSPTRQGAQLISEIKKNHPEKIVVAYTGGGDISVMEHAIQIADYYLKKDANVEEWCELLDECINNLANPIMIWTRLRHRLLDAGITPYNLAVLEDTFVKSALKGREEYEPAMLRELDRLDVNEGVRSIIYSFISSALFHVITGG